MHQYPKKGCPVAWISGEKNRLNVLSGMTTLVNFVMALAIEEVIPALLKWL
jgi:hypothetical protein